ncbi:hypothetical protein F4803DRAFT_268655 [Xylaria telfairii]|nr:hypothetical protein F4803DRAFT_268655 [Xylaria telfairii]
MAKDAVGGSGSPSDKRRTSLPSFFNKILPSTRPEQGGTARIQDMTGETDSAYEDLGMNPNELTEWNLAQERSPRSQPPGASARSQHLRGQRWNTYRGRHFLRNGAAESPQVAQQTPSFDLTQPPEASGLEPPRHAQHEGEQPTTRDEIRTTLRAKEDTRKHRKSLKESGDWLGVQGADPYSGEFVVLTPTSTFSSETTPPGTRKELEELSQRQKLAKLAYNKAKCEEETAREKNLLRKGQVKLEKIESAKAQLRQQQEFPTWIQHKRRWSSTAEPDLSPIPRSLESDNVVNNSNEVTTTPIRNFSHPPKSIDGSSIVDQSKPVTFFNNYENTGPFKHDHHRNSSTDTIVHKSPANMEFPNTSIETSKIPHPFLFPDPDDAPIQEQKIEKHFLWGHRRRMANPRKLVEHSNLLTTHSSAGKTEGSPVSDFSVETPSPIPRLESRDHFPNLSIPNGDLHLVPYPKQILAIKNSQDTMKQEPSLATTRSLVQGSRSEAPNNSVLKVATNFIDCGKPQINPQRNISDANGATAILFQSRSKRNTMQIPTFPRSIPLRSSSVQARLVQPEALQIQHYGTVQTQNHVDIDLPGYTPETQNLGQLTTRAGLRMAYLKGSTSSHTTESHEKDLEGFASTPTIIITGFDPEAQLLLEGTQSHMKHTEHLENKGGFIIGDDEPPMTPSPQIHRQELHGASSANEESEMTASSRPTTPQKNSQNFVLAHETPDTDTALTGLAIWESDPTPPAHHHEISQDQNIQIKASKTNGAGGLLRQRPKQARLAYRRRASSEHRKAMIQNAARIAIQGSQATEINTPGNRTPSPPLQDATPATPSPGSNSGGVATERNHRCIHVGFLLDEDAERKRLQNYGRGRRSAMYGGNTDKPGPLVVFVSLVITVSMTALGLATAIWAVAKPAFDARSQLWSRRRRGENTFEDHSVFVVASVLLVVAAVLVTAAVKAALWIVLRL